MAGSSLGKQFGITTWGESHGAGVGVVIDGCPAGLPLCAEEIQAFLDRRKPGASRYATPRKEEDQVQILSGVFEGKTTGTPIALMVENHNQHSKDYKEIASYYRPGHADYTYDGKYGFRDYRGGGRSSGRETIGRVAAGAVAAKLLAEIGISFYTYTKAIGTVSISKTPEELLALPTGELKKAIFANPLYMPEVSAEKAARAYLDDCIKRQDSAGGVIEGLITGLPVGIGNPVFDKLDANLAKAMLSIGAVKGFEIGDGFLAAAATGQANNDGFAADNRGGVKKNANHAGGVLGGISDGSPLIFRVAVKPTPSVSALQSTVNKEGENVTVSIHGRHDPVIVPRAVVVVEAMAALTIVELLLDNLGSRMDYVRQIYGGLRV
ncbi:chorismate synthase [Clostridia bacterium]|nr:chorismate synthase [Clostridia bacterium]